MACFSKAMVQRDSTDLVGSNISSPELLNVSVGVRSNSKNGLSPYLDRSELLAYFDCCGIYSFLMKIERKKNSGQSRITSDYSSFTHKNRCSTDDSSYEIRVHVIFDSKYL